VLGYEAAIALLDGGLQFDAGTWRAYGGTERVVAALASELVKRGHQVTAFASGDSATDAEVEPIITRALWTEGYRGDVAAYMLKGVARCWAQQHRFDIIHSHAEAFGFLLARHADVPVVSTLHGRLDEAGMPDLLADFSDIPLVAISHSQRRWHPEVNWLGVVHNGLPLAEMPSSARPGEYLLFVGRVALTKGVSDAIELAGRMRLPLKMAAKVHDQSEHELYRSVVAPAVAEGGLEFLGELKPADARACEDARSPSFIMAGLVDPYSATIALPILLVHAIGLPTTVYAIVQIMIALMEKAISPCAQALGARLRLVSLRRGE
jgi:glycosyltransferase involved in cell wall biosynthesis